MFQQFLMSFLIMILIFLFINVHLYTPYKFNYLFYIITPIGSFLTFLTYCLYINKKQVNFERLVMRKRQKEVEYLDKVNLVLLLVISNCTGFNYTHLYIPVIFIVLLEICYEVGSGLRILYWGSYIINWLPSYFYIIKEVGGFGNYYREPEMFVTFLLAYSLIYSREGLNEYFRSTFYSLILIMLWWIGTDESGVFDKLLLMALTLKHFLEVMEKGKLGIFTFIVKIFFKKYFFKNKFCCIYTGEYKEENLIFTDENVGSIVNLITDCSPHFSFSFENFDIHSEDFFGKSLLKLDYKGVKKQFEIANDKAEILNYLLLNRINLSKLTFSYKNSYLFHCEDINGILEILMNEDLEKYNFRTPNNFEKFYLGSWEVKCPKGSKFEACIFIHQSLFLGYLFEIASLNKNWLFFKKILGNSRYKKYVSDLSKIHEKFNNKLKMRREDSKPSSEALIEAFRIVENDDECYIMKNRNINALNKNTGMSYRINNFNIAEPDLSWFNELENKSLDKGESSTAILKEEGKEVTPKTIIKKEPPPSDLFDLKLVFDKEIPIEHFNKKMDEKIFHSEDDDMKLILEKMKNYKGALDKSAEINNIYRKTLGYGKILKKSVKSKDLSRRVKILEEYENSVEEIDKGVESLREIKSSLDDKCREQLTEYKSLDNIYNKIWYRKLMNIENKKDEERQREIEKEAENLRIMEENKRRADKRKLGKEEKGKIDPSKGIYKKDDVEKPKSKEKIKTFKPKEMKNEDILNLKNRFNALNTLESLEYEKQEEISKRVFEKAKDYIRKDFGKNAVKELTKPKLNIQFRQNSPRNLLNFLKNSIAYKSMNNLSLEYFNPKAPEGSNYQSRIKLKGMKIYTRIFWNSYIKSVQSNFINKFCNKERKKDSNSGRPEETSKKVQVQNQNFISSLNEIIEIEGKGDMVISELKVMEGNEKAVLLNYLDEEKIQEFMKYKSMFNYKIEREKEKIRKIRGEENL